MNYIQLGASRTTGWTLPAGSRYRRGVTPRRALFDPLQATDKSSWLVVRNMTGAVLDTQEIAARADLKRVFVATMLRWLDAGWQLGEFSSTAGTFFCTRGTERRMVGIQPNEPGHSRDSRTSGLQSCPTCGE